MYVLNKAAKIEPLPISALSIVFNEGGMWDFGGARLVIPSDPSCCAQYQLKMTDSPSAAPFPAKGEPQPA
jgi:hypothetical protein